MARTPRIHQLWLDLDIRQATNLKQDGEPPVTGLDAIQRRVVKVIQINDDSTAFVQNVVSMAITRVRFEAFLDKDIHVKRRLPSQGFVLVDIPSRRSI